jgi:palmitoyl-protein thioesterase
MHPGIFIHSVYVDPDSKEDKRATFVRSELPLVFDLFFLGSYMSRRRGQYGNVDEQVELVAQQLKGVPKLSGGFDAIGFSQGS